MGLKNPLRAVKVLTRANALHDALSDAAHDPTLYRSPRYQRRVFLAVTALVDVLPLPPTWRMYSMGLLANLLKNWKTTVIGLVTGAGIAFLSGVQGGLTPKDAAIAAGVAALGLAAKDSTVTGK